MGWFKFNSNLLEQIQASKKYCRNDIYEMNNTIGGWIHYQRDEDCHQWMNNIDTERFDLNLSLPVKLKF